MRVYRIFDDHDVALDDFQFDILTGTLSVTAVETLGSATPVANVTYDLYAGASCSGAAARSGVFDGTDDIADLTPGSYCIVLNVYEAGIQVAFPAVVKLVVPTATSAGRPAPALAETGRWPRARRATT